MSDIEVIQTCINEFKQGERIEGYYLIKSVDLKTANANGRKYLDFIISDKTGDISAKLWEVNKEIEESIASNVIVKIRGSVVAWQGSLQLKIEKMRYTTEEDNINIEEYVQSAPIKSEELYELVGIYIDSMDNQDMKNIVKHIFEKNRDRLLYYPAAKKNHHAIRGGLLYHVYTMLVNAENLLKVYDFMNNDLVYAGVILHDLSKMDEMNSNELGIVSEYTLEGTLLGHITQGVKNVEMVGTEVNADKKVIMLLQHMILSHHYEPEYGSPVKPMIPEAEMLHFLDVMDARMYDMRKLINETKPGEFSEKLWSLENRRIYNHGDLI